MTYSIVAEAGGRTRRKQMYRYMTCWKWLVFAAALAGCGRSPATQVADGNLQRGREAILRHGCTACHVIPGIAGPASHVGPPLDHVARRAYIGGVLPNRPDDMVRWLMDPPSVDPRTAMPNVGLSAAEAKDIAAYLSTLE